MVADAAGRERLSAIVPLAPGEPWRLLVAALGQLPVVDEVVLVATSESVEPIPPRTRWLIAPKGRAAQLNAGAGAAGGSVFWFLHADSTLGPGVGAALERFVTGRRGAVGHFRLAFQEDGPRLTALNAAGANWRSRTFGLPFGDQGLVVDRATWGRVGDFDERLAYGEDLDWVVRARVLEVPLVELDATLLTSARRYRSEGWLATTGRFLWRTVMLTRDARRRARERYR